MAFYFVVITGIVYIYYVVNVFSLWYCEWHIANIQVGITICNLDNGLIISTRQLLLRFLQMKYQDLLQG